MDVLKPVAISRCVIEECCFFPLISGFRWIHLWDILSPSSHSNKFKSSQNASTHSIYNVDFGNFIMSSVISIQTHKTKSINVHTMQAIFFLFSTNKKKISTITGKWIIINIFNASQIQIWLQSSDMHKSFVQM